jgi:hypothetical protein
VFGLPHYDGRVELADYSVIAMLGVDTSRRAVFYPSSLNILPLDGTGGAGEHVAGNPDAAKRDTTAIARHRRGMKRELMARNLTYLRDMIARLKDAGAKVVLVTTPTSATYYRAVDDEAYRRMQAGVNDVASTSSVPYYNYMKDPRFTWDDFVDADHLSTGGAERFTRLLGEDLLRDGVLAPADVPALTSNDDRLPFGN